MNNNVTSLRTTTIPLCVDCKNFHYGLGFGSNPYCISPDRAGNFSPVYGWSVKNVDPSAARKDREDCGIGAKFFKPIEVTPIEESPALPEKKNLWVQFKKWFMEHIHEY